MVMIGLGQFAARLMPGSNIEPVLAAKYNWAADERQRKYTYNVFLVLLGELTGAVIGGKILPKGRRRVFIIGNIFVMASACLK